MSLHDILMQRAALEFQEPAGPLDALADGISRGIAEEQERAKQAKAQQQALEQVLAISEANTNSGKLKTKVGFDLVAGKPTVQLVQPSASDIKTDRENKQLQSFKQDVISGLSARELGTKYPEMATLIQDNVEMGVIPLEPQIRQDGQSEINVVSETGSIGPRSRFDVASDRIVTEETAFGIPKTIIRKSGKIEEGKIETIQKVQEKQTEEAVKSIRSFNRVKSAAQGIVAASKRILKEQGGFGAVQQIKGKIKRGIAKTGLVNVSPEQAQAGQAELRGQLRETVLSLSPILTNQNRVIQGVIDMLSETLPKPGEATTGTEFTAQLRQTTKNAYKLSKALNTGALSAEEISDLNSANPAEVKRQFSKILAKSQWTPQDDKDFEKEWEQIKATPATSPEDLFSEGGSIANKYGL